MNDDLRPIETKLEDWAYIVDNVQGRATLIMLSGAIFQEAADEIKRLKAELEKCECRLL